MKPTRLVIAGFASLSLVACADFFRDQEQAQAQQPQPRVAEQQAQQSSQAPRIAIDEQLVRRMQQQLQAKGIDPGPIDGIWGPRTHDALQQFQQAQGLKASGQLNAATLDALGILDGTQTASARDEQASAGGSASAGAGASRFDRMFERVDKNNDGVVSREEFNETLGAPRSGAEPRAGKPSFDKLDANDDGHISLAEAGADMRVSRGFNQADKDADGRLDRREFQAALRAGTSASAGATQSAKPASR